MKSVDPPLPQPPAHAVAAAALEGSEDLLATTDGAGTITWHNERFAAATGHAVPGLVGLPLLETLRGGDTDAAAQSRLATALAQGAGCDPIELLHRRADGTSWRNRIAMRRIDAGSAAPQFLFVMRDVSELHALRADNQHLKELLDRARDLGRLGVWERDHATDQARWDRNVYRYWGLPVGTPVPPFPEVAERVHPDDRALAIERLTLRVPGSYELRYRIALPDGTLRRIHSVWEVRLLEGSGTPWSVGIMVDETDTWNLADSFLQTSERLRLAVQIAQIATWRQDLATGTLSLDERSARLLGIDESNRDMSSDQAAERIHPDDLERVRASIATALQTTEHVDFEVRHRRADLGWATILTRVVAERTPRGDPVALMGVALDVTERDASRRQASELAQRLEATAAAAGIGLWSWNLDSNKRTWNAQMWTLCGQIAQPHAPEFDDWVRSAVHPGDRDRLLGELQRWRATSRNRLDGEFRVVRPDGAVRWLAGRTHVDVTADGRTLYGVLWDVTERHTAQDALRGAYERAALAARGAGIGTWERDLEHGTTHWDPQMFLLRGLDPVRTEATHRMSMASIHPDDRALVESHHQRAAAGGEPVTYEFRAQWPDGSVHWLASRALGVFDGAGTLQRLIGVNWDVTAQKTARDERTEKEAALRESRAKSEFLARMSHELRTPLNAVLGFTQLLQAEEDGSAPARSEKLQHIRTGGEHLLALINDVLDLSSLESGQMHLSLDATPVAEVAREALAMVEQLAAARGITLEVGALDGIAMADRTRLRQVLINLLSNAIKFNRPHGRVAIRCRARGTRIAVRVADSGRGMSAEQLSHLFEPFNRLGADREGIEGTGIGLVIVKVIVERMGGTLHVASRPGRGTAFEVRLRTPDSTTDPMALAAAMPLARAGARPVLRGAKLLYIEDNPVNTLLVRELIAQRPGLELVCEVDGRSGVERARELRPDLILVDMQLPDIDGHEVLRRLQADPATAAAPCIALSANVLTEDVERALAAGFADYWTKPIDLTAFLASLDALFGPQAS